MNRRAADPEERARLERVERNIADRGLAPLVREVTIAHHATPSDVIGKAQQPHIIKARRAIWLRMRDLGLSDQAIANIWEVDRATVRAASKPVVRAA